MEITLPIAFTCASFVGFFLIYLISDVVSRTLGTYGHLQKKEKIYWSMNVCAWVHSVFAASFAVFALIRNKSYLELGTASLPLYVPRWLELGCTVSYGYFFWDLAIVLYHYKTLPQLPTLIHHIPVALGVILMLSHNYGSSIVVLALVEDISTVFLYNNYFLRKMGDHSFMVKLNRFILLITFGLFRFLFNFVILYKIHASREHLQNISPLLYLWGMFVFSIIGILNTLWAYRLLSDTELFRGTTEAPKKKH